jgi:hypothetical protein
MIAALRAVHPQRRLTLADGRMRVNLIGTGEGPSTFNLQHHDDDGFRGYGRGSRGGQNGLGRLSQQIGIRQRGRQIGRSYTVDALGDDRIDRR